MRLLADIGGTNTRCALQAGSEPPRAIAVLRNDDYPDLDSALGAYLATAGAASPDVAGLSIAAPITGDIVEMSNRSWHFSLNALRERFGLDDLKAVNDFTAIALSLPRLGPEDLLQIGAGEPAPNASMAVLGPGTGLGVSGLIPCGKTWAPIAGEGGHVTLAAHNEFEEELIAHQRAKLGHVSAERLLCGPGLVSLYGTVAALRGSAATAQTPEEITALAEHGDDIAQLTCDCFFRMLGTVAGNVALTLGAHGGVYLGGGILPALRKPLVNSGFRTRFEAKGRYADYLRGIPTYLILTPYPALIGLGTLLDAPD